MSYFMQRKGNVILRTGDFSSGHEACYTDFFFFVLSEPLLLCTVLLSLLAFEGGGRWGVGQSI